MIRRLTNCCVIIIIIKQVSVLVLPVLLTILTTGHQRWLRWCFMLSVRNKDLTWPEELCQLAKNKALI